MLNKFYDIPNHDGYKINKNGDVYSCVSKKKLKYIEDGRGYVLYILYVNGKRKAIARHRLLCITFKPNADKTKTEIDAANFVKKGSTTVCYRLQTNRTNPAPDGYYYNYADEEFAK